MAEWRSKLYSTTRILIDCGIPTHYVEIESPKMFDHTPETCKQDTSGRIFILIGAGACRMEMGDFQLILHQHHPRFAVFLTPGRTDDKVPPPPISGVEFSADSAAFGYVIMGRLMFPLWRYQSKPVRLRTPSAGPAHVTRRLSLSRI